MEFAVGSVSSKCRPTIRFLLAAQPRLKFDSVLPATLVEIQVGFARKAAAEAGALGEYICMGIYEFNTDK